MARRQVVFDKDLRYYSLLCEVFKVKRDPILSDKDMSLIDKVVHRLPRKQREILQKRFGLGKFNLMVRSIRDVADELDKSTTAVLYRQMSGLDNLAKMDKRLDVYSFPKCHMLLEILNKNKYITGKKVVIESDETLTPIKGELNG